MKNIEEKSYTYGIDYMRREIFRQELNVIRLRRENGQNEERTIEQWLTETLAHLDKVLK